MTIFNFIFILLVIAGFGFHFLATYNNPPWSSRAGWGCWLVASFLWAVTSAGAHIQ